jgi:acyl carrier protein
MTKEEIRSTVLRILGEIAPEADLNQLKPDVSFRDQLDIDSMDFLNFVIALDEELHVSIPESEYAKLSSLDNCVELLTPLTSKPDVSWEFLIQLEFNAVEALAGRTGRWKHIVSNAYSFDYFPP